MENLIQTGPPQVAAYIETEDGYYARALCLVDGRPAEYEAFVMTDKGFRHSAYQIKVFGLTGFGDWTHVYSLTGKETGRPPVAMNPDSDPDVLNWLNRLAEVTWNVANVVVEQHRKREEEIEVDMAVRRRGAEIYADRQNGGLLTSPMKAPEPIIFATQRPAKQTLIVDTSTESGAAINDIFEQATEDVPTTGHMTVATPDAPTPEQLAATADALLEDEYEDLNARILAARNGDSTALDASDIAYLREKAEGEA